MKTIQKRFYTALPRAVPHPPSSPRVRSNSAPSTRSLYTANPSSGPLAFFDSPSPPPPSSRPGNPRLPVKAEGEGSTSQHSQNGHGQTSGQPPFSLALTSPQTNASPPHVPVAHQAASFFPYSSFPPLPFYNVQVSDHSDSHKHTKRPAVRYHLDVGAYGIPKRATKHVKPGRDEYSNPSLFHARNPAAEDLDLAVQVGEDAYFVRENAMGVADGVGGWSRARGAFFIHVFVTCVHGLLSSDRVQGPFTQCIVCPSADALLFCRDAQRRISCSSRQKYLAGP